MIAGTSSSLNTTSHRRASTKFIQRRQSATALPPSATIDPGSADHQNDMRPSFAFGNYLDRQQIDLNLNESIYEETRDTSLVGGKALTPSKSARNQTEPQQRESWSQRLESLQPFFVKLGIFLLYYIVGVPIYQHLEGWSFTNTVFFLTQTYATVGYGNPTPKSITAKFFTVFYIFIGILFIFSILTDGARLIISFLRSKYKNPKKLNKFQVFTRHFLNLLTWLTVMISIPLIAALFFVYNEGWSYNEALYYAFITSTSVGYVDHTITKISTIWFDIFYIIFSITVTIIGFNKLSTFRSRLDRAELWQIMEEIELSYPLLDAIDKKKTRSVTRSDYVLHMLQLEGKISYENDLKRWFSRFKEFDLDKDGRLTEADVEAYQGGIRRNNTMRQDSVTKQSSVDKPRLSDQLQEVVNVVYRVFDEARDVVMETLFMDRTVLRPTEALVRDDVEMQTVVSPIQKAAALRNAAKASSGSFHEPEDKA